MLKIYKINKIHFSEIKKRKTKRKAQGTSEEKILVEDILRLTCRMPARRGLH